MAENHSPILSLAVSPAAENIAISHANSQVYVLPYSTTEFHVGNEIALEPLFQEFHSQEITGMDVCLRKPLVVTTSKDKTVRIWNYLERTLLLSEPFADEAFSCALHPTGQYVLVGFADKLRMLNVLMEHIRQGTKDSFEAPFKGCRECSFSTGGQYFAAAHKSNIHIYNTYTRQELHNVFRGHVGTVRSLRFNSNDTKLISSSVDGGVFEWLVHEGKRSVEAFQTKKAHIFCAEMDDQQRIVCCASDNCIRWIKNGEEIAVKQMDVQMKTLVLTHGQRLLFAGDENGFVHSFRYPFDGEELAEILPKMASNSAIGENDVHRRGHITQMRVSMDDQYLFVSGDDGAILTFEIKDKESRREKREVQMSEEILVEIDDLADKNNKIGDLQNEVNNLRTTNEYDMKAAEGSMKK